MSTKKKDFSAMSPEEIAALTGNDKKAYEKYLNALTEKGSKDESEDEAEEVTESSEFDKAKVLAGEYFQNHKDCPVDSLVICSDGAIFYNNARGKNAADNHVIANKALNVTSVIIDR
jgi:hypothetical protein